MEILVASESAVLRIHDGSGEGTPGRGLEGLRPTCLAVGPVRAVEARDGDPPPAWCGTKGGGIRRSDDGGRSWRAAGLEGAHVMCVTVGPGGHSVWAGTEPSALWRSENGGRSWERMSGLQDLPSSSGWAFPPKPETHHVRWIACDPRRPERLWLAIEAGALVSTPDGGGSWEDRVPGSPRDTHELAIHPERPNTLRVSAGDGYFESPDAGRSWCSPLQGLDVGYLRSVTIDPGDPDVVVISGASRARTAYAAGHSDGRLYRRVADAACSGRWSRILHGWPRRPETIAPLLLSGGRDGELWAADERGVHRSADGGESWRSVGSYRKPPSHLRGLARVP